MSESSYSNFEDYQPSSPRLLQQPDPQEEKTMDVSTEILIMMFLLLLSIMGGHFLKKRNHKYLQESGLTTIIGLIAGIILNFMNVGTYMTNLSKHFVKIFMILLLPPIIFESGYNMKKKSFFKNIGAILLYAFVGTFIAIIITSSIMYVTSLLSFTTDFTFRECLAFGSLISATDPVAVLAIFKEMDADLTLYTLIFGESIFNDAIAIVMYDTVTKSSDEYRNVSDQIGSSIGFFFLVFFGSILIGALSALLIAFILKRQSSFQKEDPQQEQEENQRQSKYHKEQSVNTELAMMLLCPYVSYLIAEGLELSGIVAILINGIFLSYYATPNITSTSKKVLKMSYETLAYTAETLVFIFLGFGLFSFQHPYKEMGAWTMIFTIINLGIARYANVYFVSWIVNKFRSKNQVNSRFKFVMWVSGLRGAMAYALALESLIDFPKRGPVILIITLLYAFLSILGVGSILRPILEKMDVMRKKDGDQVGSHDENSLEDEQVSNNRCHRIKNRIQKFDTYYFAPLFIKDQRRIQNRMHDDTDTTSRANEEWGSPHQPKFRDIQ